jgi:integrase
MGKVKFRADRNYWFVQWGNHKITHYKGFLCRDGEIHGMKGQDMAKKLLAVIQADSENCSGLGIPFQIERYLEQRVDTIPYMREWLEAIKSTLKPATHKDYLNSIQNHLIPWFKINPYRLHEVKYDILCKILSDIKRDGKGKRNVMYCLHACMDYACKSGHIMNIPPFPEAKKYGIIKRKRKGIPSVRQEAILRAIPEYHQPIFWWLKYHFRRPSEACALFKEDYDSGLDAFTIRRTFSNRQMVDSTKTGTEHVIPCNPDFTPIMQKMPITFGKFFFENPSRDCKTKKTGRHYTLVALEYIWNIACGKVGETISLYPGTKHSSCWQFLNEKGGTVDELQSLTDHARRDSVDVYAEMEIEAKRRLMGKVMPLKEKKENEGN